MIMHDTETKSTGKFFLKTCLDPVLLYTAVVMAALMYHYRSSLAIPYGIVSYIAGWLVFRIFDFVNKHKFLGAIAYGLTGVLVLAATGYVVRLGENDYPIPFWLWFLTPQDSVEYNKWFTLAIYLLFFMFMASAVYYFTKVRYRIFMNFLLFIIPFAIYGKEYEKMPTIYIILLAVGYIVLMIEYRQLQNNDKTVIVNKSSIWKPIAVYTAVFASAAAIVPKPHVEADRTYIETLMNADAFTDRLNKMLDVFRETTDNNYFSAASGRTLILVGEAVEPLKIKTSTFTTYDFDKDSWSVEEPDKDFEWINKEEYKISEPASCLQAYLAAAGLDEDFAEKYGLSGFAEDEPEMPPTRDCTIYLARSTVYAPVPERALSMESTEYRGDISATTAGVMSSGKRSFDAGCKFTFKYAVDDFMNLGRNKEMADALCCADYDAMSEEAMDILDEHHTEDAKYTDYYNVLYEERENFLQYEDLYLDYGSNAKIKQLADELTQDISSDYEKAKIFERYFYENDYIYDLKYRKDSSENAETFIFSTKTGVCYEYATAMIMLSRAAGIPARFCEGYSMSEPFESERFYRGKANLSASSKDAHGFPELYIKGYGWMTFEPTLTDSVSGSDNVSATNLLARAGMIILVVLLLILGIAKLYPRISHRVFLVLCRKKSPSETAAAVMHRIRRLYGAESGCTSKETAELAAVNSGADIGFAAEMFDKAVYGEEILSEAEKTKILEEYVRAYMSLTESKKRRHKAA